jgi:DNA-binding CsgD family transcriptional regulator
MSSSTGFSRAEVDHVLAAVAEATRADEVTPFPLPVIERLLAVVRADRGGYYEYKRGSAANIFDVEQPRLHSPWGTPEVRAALWSWPLQDPRWVPAPAVCALSQRLSERERERNPFGLAFYRLLGVRDEIKLWLPAPDGYVCGFWFTRSETERDFDEHEHGLLDLLGPHLAAARQRWGLRHEDDRLSVREREVMALVADGLTNAAIARRLVVSTGTVRSHLDNVYEKLGVHTRTAAVAALSERLPV